MASALWTVLPSRMSLRSLKWSLLLLSLLSFLVMWYLSLPHYNVIERVNWMYFYEIHLDVCQLRRVIAAHGFSSKEIITFWQVMLRNTTCHY
ncbi:B3GALNT1 isoform 5 [Pongo abelii]|uniref:B3GALNT1 isoform 5 n=1 Tax=Pongo abelii TaxID=9601 RepID=A0A2J8WTR4_PONAB|nr:B3GALNT1 isoform 5 [Pongo abelii]